MKKLLSVICVCCFGFISIAQNKTSFVYLKDGSSLQGKIINETSEKITLRKKKVNQLINVSEIEKIVPWKEAPATSPKNSISLSVNSLISGRIALSYERRLFTKKMSLGGSFLITPSENFAKQYFTGFEFSPTYRYYIYGEANSYGFYVQAKAFIGYYKGKQNNIDFGLTDIIASFEDMSISGISSYKYLKDDFMCYGGGVYFGYLFNLHPHWGIDFNLGIKILSADKTSLETYIYDEDSKYTYYDETTHTYVTAYEEKLYDTRPLSLYRPNKWNTGIFGAAFPLDLKLSLVYRF